MTRLLWGLGLVGLVFGVLNVVVGLLVGSLDPLWIAGNLLLGAVLLVAAAASSADTLRERMSSGEARRAGRYGTSAVLGTVIGIVILGLLGFLATRYHARFDWSEQKVHSLSEQSVKLLEGLEQDVEVLALYPPLDVAPVREVLDRFAYVSDRFQVTYADPNERPELLVRHGIDAEQLGEGLVQVGLGAESVELDEVTEEKITNALVKLGRTAEKRVYFVEGHNERAVQGEDGEAKEGFARAAQALRNENYQVEPLLLAQQGEVPADANAVVVAGATRPLLDEEHAALERYLERGGALLVLLDPRARTDLVDDVRRWGVDLGDDVVVDRQLALFGRATSPFAGSYDPAHEITRGMRDASLFHMVRSVRNPEGGSFTELVFTGDSSWAERDLDRFFEQGEAELDDADVAGPVSIAVAGRPAVASVGAGAGPPMSEDPDAAPAAEAAEEAGEADGGAEEGGARLAVFGDVDFAANELIEAYLNRDLFVNTVNWLIGDIEAIAIRPRLSRASRFQLSAEQFLTIRSLSLFVLPEAIAVLGVFVWWWRRRAPA